MWRIKLIFCLFWLLSAGDICAGQYRPVSFQIIGFHLDLRIQVMKMPALKEFVLNLSKHGVNTLIMEWEAAYPYDKHAVISNSYAYTREEIISFVDYCRALDIDVIPLQQSFGHVEYILKHSRYKDLREDQKDYSQVNPMKEDLCRSLFEDLYRDMIATHKSMYIHIGGDETYLLGHSEESKRKVAQYGMGRLYGDYIKMLCELVASLGKIPVVWADIALKYPEALEDLPEETVFVDWNYGWELDRFGDHRKLVEKGFEIWGAPAIRSAPDNQFITDWAKHFNNIKTFIPQARGLGYRGIIMTSWSTSGIYSPIFESSSDILDLHAVRRVYPISGFNMLIDAFFESLEHTDTLDVENFVRNYAMGRYGLHPDQARHFWKALASGNYEVNQGVVSQQECTLDQLLDSARRSLHVFQSMRAKRNRAEFEHYVLMAQMRYNYLVSMVVESEINQDGYRIAHREQKIRRLKQLNVRSVDRRFKKIHKGVLYDREIEQEKYIRNYRYHDLLSRLQNLGSRKP